MKSEPQYSDLESFISGLQFKLGYIMANAQKVQDLALVEAGRKGKDVDLAFYRVAENIQDACAHLNKAAEKLRK